MNNYKLKTYRFSRETVKEIDYLASAMLRSRNSTLVYLVHQAYVRELKRRRKADPSAGRGA